MPVKFAGKEIQVGAVETMSAVLAVNAEPHSYIYVTHTGGGL